MQTTKPHISIHDTTPSTPIKKVTSASVNKGYLTMARFSDDNENSEGNAWPCVPTEGKAWRTVSVGSRYEQTRGNYNVRCSVYFDAKSDPELKGLMFDLAAASAGFS